MRKVVLAVVVVCLGAIGGFAARYWLGDEARAVGETVASVSPSEVPALPASYFDQHNALSPEGVANVPAIAAQIDVLDQRISTHLLAVFDEGRTVDPAGVQDTLDSLYKLTLLVQRLQQTPPYPKEIVFPSWKPLLDREQGSKADRFISTFARRLAGQPGCIAEPSDLKFPDLFWFEYSLSKMDVEKRSCNVFPHGWLESPANGPDAERIGRLKKRMAETVPHVFLAQVAGGSASACAEPEMAKAVQFDACKWAAVLSDVEVGNQDPRSLEMTKSFVSHAWPEHKERTAAAIKEDVARLAQKLVGRTPDQAWKLLQYREAIKEPSEYWIGDGGKLLVLRFEASYSERVGAPAAYLMVLSKERDELIDVPGNFGQYDNGDVAGISDIDGDGNIEVWISATWGECDGEDEEPGETCSIPHLYMMEQLGSQFIPFVKGPRPAGWRPS
ncbi:MAG: hypothetical protein QM776_11515 [Rhodocyclaceae bacterium]